MTRTLTEDYWLLKGELARMTKQFNEARDIIDKFTAVIQRQEEEIKDLDKYKAACIFRDITP